MSKSSYLGNQILDQILGGEGYSPPPTVYFGLATEAITNSTTGSTVTEPRGNGYTRVAVTNDITHFPAASNGRKSNGSDITFPTATGSWGTVTHIFVANEASEGNILYHAALSANQTVEDGDTAKFASGAVVFTED